MPDDAPREDEHKPDDESPCRPLATTSRPRCCERFEGAVFHDSHGQPVVYLDRAHWAEAATFLRDEQQFTMLLDVTAVDHLVDVERLAVAGRRRRSASRSSPTTCRTRATGASG